MNKRAGWIFVLCRVEFSKIGKHDVTFIREMRVHISLVHMKFIKNGIGHQNRQSDRKKLLKFEAEGREFLNHKPTN